MRNLSKIKSILAGVLLVVPLAFAHYYIARPITNPTSVVGTATQGAATTSTQWFCVNAAGAVSGGPWTTQALAEAPCGTAVAADGVTRYLEERVTTTRPTTQTTSTRRVELLGGTGVRVSDAQAGVITQSGPIYFPPTASGDITALYANVPITIYAAPADVGTGDGTNEANAMDLPTAIANATAGTRIGVLPGIYENANAANKSPAWKTAAAGTAGAPIIIVAKYPAAGLPNVTTNANRSELRHSNGTAYHQNGGPVVGANSSTNNYSRWIGFLIDERESYTRMDNGPVYIAGATGVWIKYCVIIATTDAAMALDNHSGIRVGEASTNDTDHAFIGNIISGYTVGLDSNAAGILLYGNRNMTIDGNTISDSNTGIYIKGSGGSGANFNYGTISRNRIENTQVGMRIQATDATNDLTITGNLIKDFSISGLAFNDSGGNVQNVIMTRNTVLVTEAVTAGGFWLETPSGTGNEFNDNIVALFGSTGHNYVYGIDYTANGFAAFDYNGFYGSTDGTPWSWNGANQNTVGGFEAAVTNSNNNQVLGSNPFVSQGTGDYTVIGAALTASSTGGPIGADYSLVGPQ